MRKESSRMTVFHPDLGRPFCFVYSTALGIGCQGALHQASPTMTVQRSWKFAFSFFFWVLLFPRIGFYRVLCILNYTLLLLLFIVGEIERMEFVL